ncbi:MAG: TolC family protein, partial [Duncaniella sp.]|nr:TolC family protein [Duncaniella sp.]
MKTRFLIIFLILWSFTDACGLTIEECIDRAQENYPVIRKYGLLEATSEIDLSEISKSWLPRIGLYGQGSAQNVVPSFPSALSGFIQQMGQHVRGIGKMQYKAGVDILQNIWDGGTSVERRSVVRSKEALKQASLDVDMYAVRERVENIYFAILQTEEQIAQIQNTQSVLEANLEKLRSMLRNGTAMQSDVDMVEAQFLTLNQSIRQAQASVEGYRTVLGIFTASDVMTEKLEIPETKMPVMDNQLRPELRLFAEQMALNNAMRCLTDTSLRPKVGFFAQAYYGYPGFDYFKSMMNRDLSFNILAGVKVSWNIDSFYNRGNAARRAKVSNEEVEVERDLFLFNNRLQTVAQ